jgi:hypothetical protein
VRIESYRFVVFGLLPFSAFSFSQTPSSSEVDNIGPWWQVEMILFTQGNNWTTSSEVWPTDLELSYPDTWQELTPLFDPTKEAIIEDANAPTDTPPSDPTQANRQDELALDPGKLKLLPEAELQLTDIRKKLDRGRRRILFHGAWRQFMERNQAEPPIIFSAGDQYDDHYEVEGSIHIYLQRLLHVDLNLWLSEFSINAGQEREPWPELPKRPNLRIPAYRLSDFDRLGLTSNTPLFTDSNSSQVGGINSNRLDPSPGVNTGTGQINALDWFDQRGNITFYDSRYDEILSRNYLVNNLSLIKQDRPMRSDELHYIDHPQLGILVKISRYQPPQQPVDQFDADLEKILGPKPE